MEIIGLIFNVVAFIYISRTLHKIEKEVKPKKREIEYRGKPAKEELRIKSDFYLG